MTNYIEKVHVSIIRIGLDKTIFRIIGYPIRKLRQYNKKRKIFGALDTEDKFTWIYNNNYWGNRESLSGSGSTFEYTENLRNKIPELINKLSINIVLDAPCGDFNWMKYLLEKIDITYIGGDIVLPMIESNNKYYKNDKTTFVHIDLINDRFPAADLMICRDCLFHLSYKDIRSVLKNFIDSNIPYILTSTHINQSFKNKDIVTGDFRLIDLFSSPFNLSPRTLFRIDDGCPPYTRQMCLWNRNQIIDCLKQF